MRNYRHLSTFTLVLLFLSGALKPFNFFIVEALAACAIQGNTQEDPAMGALAPADNDTVNCNDADTAGIDAVGSTGVTVNIQAPDGSISVTDKPGIRLGDNATVTVAAPDRPVTVQGNDVPGIQVGNMSAVTVQGVVSTGGDFSSAIVTGDNSTVNIDGGVGQRQVTEVNGQEVVETVSTGGIVRTEGSKAPAVVVGAGSMVNAIGRSQIATTNTESHAVVLNGATSQLSVSENATVTTTGSMANAVRMNGTGSQLTVAGTVSSAASNTAAVVGATENVVLNVRDGGTITTLSSGSNAIEMTSTGARITVENGGEVKVTSGNSVAIIAGGGATVVVNGQVSAAGAGSQGIVLGDGASLTVQSQGRIETSLSATQAVRISETANTATVNLASGSMLNAVSGQAIVDAGATNTSVTVGGSVTGGGTAPVLDLGDGNDSVSVIAGGSVTGSGTAPVLALGGGNDNVTVNGSVRSTNASTSAQPVIDLGSGDDTLNDNSSQTIAGPGVLATGGTGNDTLNLNNGKINDSASYQGFEVTNVGTNNNPGDPLNGMGSTLNVTDNQAGNVINVSPGSMLNVRNGGVVDLRADGTANPSGVAGNSITFDAGATANVQVANVTGVQPTQNFTSTTFSPNTIVNTGSGFLRGVVSNDANTGVGSIEVRSDFTNSARTSNGTSIANALNTLSNGANVPATQQAALNALIANAANTAAGESALANVAGEVRVQAAASGLNTAMQFNNALIPSGNRISSRGATIATNPVRAEEVFEQPAVGNGVWVSGLGSLMDISRNTDSTAASASTYGVAVGYDRAANLGTFGTAVFGVGAGYSTTNVNGIQDSASVNGFSLGTYLDGHAGPFSGHVAASYSSQDISSDVGSGGNGSIFAISSEAFLNVRPESNLAVGPIGRLDAAFGNYGGFNTNSDAFSIAYDGTGASQVTGAVGVRVGGQNPVDVGFMALNLDLLYESSLGDDTVRYNGRLGESEVSIAAPTANQSGFFIGAEAALAISDNSSVGFRYQGKLGSNIQAHTGEIKFSLLF